MQPSYTKMWIVLSFLSSASCYNVGRDLKSRRADAFISNVGPRAAGTQPLVVENLCSDSIWPAVASQHGTGPATAGFELKPGESKSQTTSADWQGRVWGRTNCSFNSAGTGPSNPNGGNACDTGDCAGVLDCVVTGNTPVTLFEVLYQGGTQNKQDYYDISLVDGYNLPMGLTYIPGNTSTSQDIPPNLTNAICIGSAGWASDVASTTTNATYPLPYVSSSVTNNVLAKWCPWDLLVNAPTKPGDGVYPYPDDSIQRPLFSPCHSQCDFSHAPADCCTGAYDSPDVCKATLYSTQSKTVCPDAYSFAYDDQTSTFIIPSGGGWKVTFCPTGKSTNILKTFGAQLLALASGNTVSEAVIMDAQNLTLIQRGDAPGVIEERRKVSSLGLLVALVVWLCFW